MSPKRTRKHKTRYKTTTKLGKREYMRKYMRAKLNIPSYKYRKRSRKKKK